MCLSPNFADNVVHLAKFVEPLFWVMEIVFVANLIKSEFFVKQNIKFINTMLKYQGVVEQITMNDNVLRIFKRDILILTILNALVIQLISIL